MIAAYALYALLFSLLIATLALLLERGARIVGIATRFVWMAAMVVIVAAPTMAVMRDTVTTSDARSGDARSGDARSRSEGETGERVATPATTRTPATHDVAAAAMRAIDRPARAWRALLTSVTEHTQRFDGLFVGLWATLSIFVFGLGLHATSYTRQLRLRFEQRVVDGTPVFVSEFTGPAAIGGTPPAIVIPKWILALDESLLSLVMRHEREHLAARDPALLLGGLVLLVLMPWHIGLWWGWHKLRVAIEVDCDARVLRHEPNPTRYAQLLLLMTHHHSRFPRGVRTVMTLAAPLHPHAAQLKRRIDQMTAPRFSRPRAALLAVGVCVLGVGTLTAALPAPERAATVADASTNVPHGANDSVTVTVNSVGSRNIRVDANGTLVGDILIYGTGPVRIGLGLAPLTLVGDTIRLKTFPAFTADVTNGDVHVELRGSEGTLEIGGIVHNGPATKVGASGRHLVLLKGGMGINTVRP